MNIGELPGATPTPLAISPDEDGRLQREDGFNGDPSWGWAHPPRGAPYRIINLLRRMRMDTRRWREFVDEPDPDDPGRRDWANPRYGWSPRQTTLNVLEMGREGALSIETLLLLSDAAYGDSRQGRAYWEGDGMPAAFEDNPSFFDADSGWVRVLGRDDPQTGFRVFALYNPRTRTVVIVNRGTRNDLRDPAAIATDVATDKNIFSGVAPRSFDQAHDFMRDVWQWMKNRGLQGAQVIVTGHSLGGALAQLELAVANRDPGLAGMRVFGVTFAGLGAKTAILDHLARRGLRSVPQALDQFGERLLNFVRAGDGLPYRGEVYGPRSEGIGVNEELGGLYMNEIKRLEGRIGANNPITMRLIRQFDERRPDAIAHFLKLLVTERDDHTRLAILYVLNHSLRSFYRPELSEPLGDTLRKRGRNASDSLH